MGVYGEYPVNSRDVYYFISWREVMKKVRRVLSIALCLSLAVCGIVPAVLAEGE